MADYAVDCNQDKSLWWLIIFIWTWVNGGGANQTGRETTGLSWKTTYFRKQVVSLWSLLSKVYWEGKPLLLGDMLIPGLEKWMSPEMIVIPVVYLQEVILQRLYTLSSGRLLFHLPKIDQGKHRDWLDKCSALRMVREVITTQTTVRDYNMPHQQ